MKFPNFNVVAYLKKIYIGFVDFNVQLCISLSYIYRHQYFCATQVLCIDEATASVDLRTDQLIQVTIREHFRDNTILTIAHRTDTILDSDRVLVMHDGKVVEFAPPGVLMQNKKSVFYGLVHGNAWIILIEERHKLSA